MLLNCISVTVRNKSPYHDSKMRESLQFEDIGVGLHFDQVN